MMNSRYKIIYFACLSHSGSLRTTMDGSRLRSNTLATSTLKRDQFRQSIRRCSFDVNFPSFKDFLGGIAESFDSLLSETKSSALTLLDGLKTGTDTNIFFEDTDQLETHGKRHGFQNDQSLVGFNDSQSSTELFCDQRQDHTGTNKKCIEWMSKITEEATPKSMHKSFSETKFMVRSRDFHADLNPRCYDIKKKKFCKAKSDLRDLLTNSASFSFESKEEFNTCIRREKEINESTEQLHHDTKQFIFDSLNEMDNEQLILIMQHLDITYTPLNKSNEKMVNSVPECEQIQDLSPHHEQKITHKEEVPTFKKDYLKSKTNLSRTSLNGQGIYVGEIKISIQYLLITKRLKVTIKSVSGLQQMNKQKQHIFVSVSLISQSKKTKQTKTKRNQENVVFNYDIYFKNTSIETFHSLLLRVNVYRKSALFSRKSNTPIGECTVHLDNHDVVSKANLSEKLLACQELT